MPASHTLPWDWRRLLHSVRASWACWKGADPPPRCRTCGSCRRHRYRHNRRRDAHVRGRAHVRARARGNVHGRRRADGRDALPVQRPG